MRVLFIDFDGVLHAVSGPADAMRQFVWVPLLVNLLENHPDVHLVVHASARQHSPADFLQQRLGRLGVRMLGVTPPRLARHESIVAWLAEHPEVQDWRVLDDSPKEFPLAWAPLILCDGRQGVSNQQVQQVLLAWLAGAPTAEGE